MMHGTMNVKLVSLSFASFPCSAEGAWKYML